VCSSSCVVTSGVPQGSVLGPALFLLYINNLTKSIKSSVRLFADDCLIYSTINSPSDHLTLQEDLDRLATWAENWQMKFNVQKCSIMRMTKQQTESLFCYTILGQTPTVVEKLPLVLGKQGK